jgi:hypothetical protein
MQLKGFLMRVSFFSEQPNPKWTDETLPVELRKQILADELRRVTRHMQGPAATPSGRRAAPAERTEHAS